VFGYWSYSGIVHSLENVGLTMKTSELTGAALDWAVAKCEGDVTELAYDGITWGFKLDGKLKVLAKGWADSMSWHPSTNWAQGGPIIERVLLYPEPLLDDNCSLIEWFCYNWKGDGSDYYGPTPLIAVMRCYVASKLGENVDIPEELL